MTAVERVYVCDEAEARDLTEKIKASGERTCRLIKNAHDWRAWAALGYDSWRDYAMTELGVSQSQAYRVLDLARVAAAIEAAAGSPMGELTEREARDLKPHLPELTAAVADAVADLPEDDRPAAAAAAVKTTRERFRPQPSPPPVPALAPPSVVPGESPTTGGGEHDVPYVPDLKALNLSKEAYQAKVTALGETVPVEDPKPDPNPLADARAKVAKQPAMLAAKAVERLRTSRLTFEAAGTAAEIVADLVNDGLADGDQGDDWLPEIDAALEVLGLLASALRRRNLRSIKP